MKNRAPYPHANTGAAASTASVPLSTKAPAIVVYDSDDFNAIPQDATYVDFQHLTQDGINRFPFGNFPLLERATFCDVELPTTLCSGIKHLTFQNCTLPEHFSFAKYHSLKRLSAYNSPLTTQHLNTLRTDTLRTLKTNGCAGLGNPDIIKRFTKLQRWIAPDGTAYTRQNKESPFSPSLVLDVVKKIIAYTPESVTSVSRSARAWALNDLTFVVSDTTQIDQIPRDAKRLKLHSISQENFNTFPFAEFTALEHLKFKTNHWHNGTEPFPFHSLPASLRTISTSSSFTRSPTITAGSSLRHLVNLKHTAISWTPSTLALLNTLLDSENRLEELLLHDFSDKEYPNLRQSYNIKNLCLGSMDSTTVDAILNTLPAPHKLQSLQTEPCHHFNLGSLVHLKWLALDGTWPLPILSTLPESLKTLNVSHLFFRSQSPSEITSLAQFLVKREMTHGLQVVGAYGKLNQEINDIKRTLKKHSNSSHASAAALPYIDRVATPTSPSPLNHPGESVHRGR